MTPPQLLHDLRRAGLKVALRHDGKIGVKGDLKRLAPEITEAIITHRDALAAILKAEAACQACGGQLDAGGCCKAAACRNRRCRDCFDRPGLHVLICSTCPEWEQDHAQP